jgi:glucose-6-phosphate isomerase
LHIALRAPSIQKIVVDEIDVVKEVQQVRQSMADFANGVRNGKIVGATGKPFTHIINVGIGGSDLGPALVWDALSQTLTPSLHCSFVSNIDPVDVEKVLEGHDAQHTLIVMCSKTFSTTETLSNNSAMACQFGRRRGSSATLCSRVGGSATCNNCRHCICSLIQYLAMGWWKVFGFICCQLGEYRRFWL